MKLVFFDIECASVHKTYAKICAFGYVVCDEQFNILEKQDLLINPRGKFELTDRKGENGIVLPYEYAEFKKHPPFPAVFRKIKALLEDKDTCVFGHAVLNDVKYLNLETRRFRLPSFKFRFYDSQLIFMSYIGDFSRQFGLEGIAEKLGVEFTPHRAVDDSYATMKIVEAMCKAKNCTYAELIDEFNVSAGKIENYVITRPQSKGMKQFNAEKRAIKMERARVRMAFNDHFLRKRYKKGGKLKGATFTFSRRIEDDVTISLPLVDKIYELGGRYTQDLDYCDIFVEAQDDDTGRTKSARASERIKTMDMAALKELLDD